MNLATEMELRELLTKYLADNPQHETIYIKICDNTVRVSTSVDDVNQHRPYPYTYWTDEDTVEEGDE